MTLGTWDVTVAVSAVDETQLPGENPADYVVRLAEQKARAAAQAADSADAIVAADTTVVDGQVMLGKPVNTADAVRMLRQLGGRTHRVFTGLAVWNLRTDRLLTDLCMTDVPMRNYSDAEIDQYVGSGDPFDKAGGYAIQHSHFHPVDNLNGCYASVMGLPLCHLLRLFSRLELDSPAGLPAACQAHLHYVCPVTNAILRGEQVG